MRGLLFAGAFLLAVIIGAGKDIVNLSQEFMALKSARAEAREEVGLSRSVTAVRGYAEMVDIQTERANEDYRYRCGDCERYFDAKNLDGRCPHCGSRKILSCRSPKVNVYERMLGEG